MEYISIFYICLFYYMVIFLRYLLSYFYDIFFYIMMVIFHDRGQGGAGADL